MNAVRKEEGLPPWIRMTALTACTLTLAMLGFGDQDQHRLNAETARLFRLG